MAGRGVSGRVLAAARVVTTADDAASLPSSTQGRGEEADLGALRCGRRQQPPRAVALGRDARRRVGGARFLL